MRDATSCLDMRKKSIPKQITVSYFFSNKVKQHTYYTVFFFVFFFFLVMINFGSTDNSGYTGFREIMDRDVLDLQCIEIKRPE